MVQDNLEADPTNTESSKCKRGRQSTGLRARVRAQFWTDLPQTWHIALCEYQIQYFKVT
jgi:hypothetical protein